MRRVLYSCTGEISVAEIPKLCEPFDKISTERTGEIMRFVTVRFMKSEPRAESKLRRKMTGNLKAKRKFPSHAWEFNPLTAERSADAASDRAATSARGFLPARWEKKVFPQKNPFAILAFALGKSSLKQFSRGAPQKLLTHKREEDYVEMHGLSGRKRERSPCDGRYEFMGRKRRVANYRRHPVSLSRVLPSLCKRPFLWARADGVPLHRAINYSPNVATMAEYFQTG